MWTSTPKLKNSLTITNGSGVVLVPAGSAPSLQVQAIGHQRVQVTVQALLPAVARRLLESEQLSEKGYFDTNESKLLHQQVIALQPNVYGEASLNIDLSKADLPAGAAYLARVSPCRDADCELTRYRSYDDQQVVVLHSRYALSALVADSETLVSMRDFDSGELIARGSIELLAKNSESLGSFAIRGDGYARIPNALMRGQNGSAPALLINENNRALSYLSLNESPLSLAQLPVDGADTAVLGDGYLRTERGVYRGGESVYFSAIARADDLVPMAGQNLTLKIIRPDSKVLTSQPVTSDSNGLLSTEITLGATAHKGRYRAQLLLGDTQLASTGFQVEDFVPETMEVNITGLPEFAAIDQTLAFSTESLFLFGAPGADRPISAQLRANPTRQPFDVFDGFKFGGLDENHQQQALLDSQTLQTSEAGRADFEFSASAFESIANSELPQRVTVAVELEEVSGRVTRQKESVFVATQPSWIGVKPADAQSGYGSGSTPEFLLTSVNARSGQANSETVRWRLIEEEWDYYWTRSGEGWDYRIEYYEQGVRASGTVEVNAASNLAQATLTLPALSNGRYKLELLPETGQPTQTRLQVGWWSTSGASAAVPDVLDVAVSDLQPNAGDTVTVSIDAPFNGTAEIMLVTDSVLSVHQVVLADRKASVDVKAPAGASQAYVLVKAYRQAPAGSAGAARAVGVAHLSIEPERFRRQASMDLPEFVRPNQTVSLTVNVSDAADGASLVVSAVDIGILNLTNHPQATAFDWFTRKRSFSADLFDPYGLVSRLSDDIGGTNLVVGGDEAAAEQPSRKTFFETIALQTGVVKVRNGKAEFALDIGQINGRLRLDVTGSDGRRSIQFSDELIVRERVAVNSSVPRTVTRGDRFQAGAALTLTEGEAQTAVLEWSVTGPFELGVFERGQSKGQSPQSQPSGEARGQSEGQSPQSGQTRGLTSGLSPKSQSRGLTSGLSPQLSTKITWTTSGQTREVSVPVKVTANGQGSIGLRVTLADGHEQSYQWPLLSRPGGSLITLTETREVAPGATTAVPLDLLAVLDDGRASLSVSRFPLPDRTALAASLSRYPYGCLEQTVSRAFPLIVMDQTLAERGKFTEARERLGKSYRRIADLQRSSGMFSMWSDGGDSEEWLSLYAYEFLLHPLPEGVFEANDARHLDRLRQQMLTDMAPNLPRLMGSNNAEVKIYALLLGARQGNADVGEMRYLLSQTDGLTMTSASQLAMAFSLLGDKPRAEQAFAIAVRADSESYRYSTYATPVRHRAALARYSAEAKSDKAESALAAMTIAVNSDPWLNTQEKAWAYLATEAAHASATPKDGAWSLNRSVNELDLSETDKGLRLTNHSDESLHLTLVATGNRADRGAEENAGEAVAKNLPPSIAKLLLGDAEGKPADVSLTQGFAIVGTDMSAREASLKDGVIELQQGELLVSTVAGKITRERADGEWLIEQKAAGGLEIENPNLGGISVETLFELLGFPWQPKDSVHSLYLDDRFTQVIRPRYQFGKNDRLESVSVWRAVTPGNYRMPATYMENMLNPSLNASTEGVRIHVTAN
ncbi:alpha-2-macroglobulin family protein [Marinobacter sp. LV10MA510-1]|uniref:alpha-2-macroglobulin family protein n=1 Tax=Marinobacter sp. LV10MA510-1 TaxID=1415567 RepID=UPI0015CF169D|nr:MG2 domain-containing protein [Marinobacter sp. LV10MA510-1]